ncbi:hypothetical protein HID58_072175 [Brassica napus]|uniref:Uncharacterized protein n=1 Tax=Brassica napus TaxID=3708 RepID=A0ABQ7Z3U7_BRANA|nr:hypothetical protein HID58_072175 [Brassica napus]
MKEHSEFHESTTQGHPSIDGVLPLKGRLQYYIVESGQGSMAEFNQCFHLLYLAWKLLLAQTTSREAQARLVESSMRILGFGFWVLLNLFVLLILSLAKILPLRIPGSHTSTWGTIRIIILYADVPGFSIKLSANSGLSPLWGQRLIFIKQKKKVLQVIRIKGHTSPTRLQILLHRPQVHLRTTDKAA